MRLLFTTLLWAVGGALAEDGSQGWLRYARIPNGASAQSVPSTIIALNSTRISPVYTAGQELQRGVLGTTSKQLTVSTTASQDQSAIIVGTTEAYSKAYGKIGESEDLEDDGFYLSISPGKVIIIGQNERGALYGAFEYLSQLAQNNITFGSKVYNPQAPIRWVNEWDNLDGSIERGYAGPSIFFRNGYVVDNTTRIAEYARLLASIRVNGAIVNNVNADPALLNDRNVAGLGRIADAMRPYGVQIGISLYFASPQQSLGTFDPLDPRVDAWWANITNQIYSKVPDMAGYLVKANSEGQPGPLTYNRTLADGANMFARALKPHGGVVMFRAFVYDNNLNPADWYADRANAQLEFFQHLDGKFDENIVLQIKFGPIDFQVREPPSPLFASLRHTSTAIELQITPEYLGQNCHLVYLAPQWKEILEFDMRADNTESRVKDIVSGKRFKRPIGGYAGVSGVGSNTTWLGSHLAMSNLYAFGRLAWDASSGSETILQDWIRLTFGFDQDVLDTVTDMSMKSWPAYENYSGNLGIQTLTDILYTHYGPNPASQDGNGWGQWTRADGFSIGMDRTVRNGTKNAGQYPPEIARIWENIELTPDNLVLWFHHVPYTHRLKSNKTVIQHFYDAHYEGAQTAQEFVRQWESLEGKIDKERFEQVLFRQTYQAGHALVWRDAINEFYFNLSRIPDEAKRVGNYPYRIEAESMTLQNYKVVAVKPFETASGFKGIVTTSNGTTGVAKAKVPFASGRYNVAVNYWDMIGGRSKYQLSLGNRTVGLWTGDLEDKLGHAPSVYLDGHSATRITFRNVWVERGEEVRISGQANGAEPAPVDYVSFLPSGIIIPDISSFARKVRDARHDLNAINTNLIIIRTGLAIAQDDFSTKAAGLPQSLVDAVTRVIDSCDDTSDRLQKAFLKLSCSANPRDDWRDLRDGPLVNLRHDLDASKVILELSLDYLALFGQQDTLDALLQSYVSDLITNSDDLLKRTDTDEIHVNQTARETLSALLQAVRLLRSCITAVSKEGTPTTTTQPAKRSSPNGRKSPSAQSSSHASMNDSGIDAQPLSYSNIEKSSVLRLVVPSFQEPTTPSRGTFYTEDCASSAQTLVAPESRLKKSYSCYASRHASRYASIVSGSDREAVDRILANIPAEATAAEVERFGFFFMRAAYEMSTDILPLLTEFGADITRKNVAPTSYYTAVHAATLGSSAIARAGQTPLQGEAEVKRVMECRRDPATGEIFAHCHAASAANVDDVVKTAHRVFKSGVWSKAPRHVRADILDRIAALLTENLPRLIQLEVRQTGRAIREMNAQVPTLTKWFKYYAALIRTEERSVLPTVGKLHNWIDRKPLGVVAQITPFNHPMLIAVKKIAPALAAGNCIVLKPSELTPLTSIELGKLMKEAGLPDGVFNVLPGDGITTGKALVQHPLIKKVDVTGGTPAGRAIGAIAGGNLAHYTAELGGKAPLIIFEKANLDLAVNGVAFASFIASGQTCVAATRIIVQNSILDDAVAKLKTKAQSIEKRMGSPKNVESMMGPLISRKQLANVEALVNDAKQAGTTAVSGGERMKGESSLDGIDFSTGYFYPPTILTNGKSTKIVDTRIWREEAFGPVIVVVGFDTEDEAIELANDSEFGLGAAIWTQDLSQAFRVSESIESGICWVNTHHRNDPSSPWGGIKSSGVGSENGVDAYNAYTTSKSTIINYATEEEGLASDDWFREGTGEVRYG
ncbi:putative alpha-glucuronidase A [Bipolaris maydis]|uniref:putative alpha-glucuronidase A n=1 Tax=Cochliobolus heterostrophus TaxID=5016 RepID=UPI0024D9581A|nr:putative alpha-glucuronidase A [Bipolaris maydis]